MTAIYLLILKLTLSIVAISFVIVAFLVRIMFEYLVR